MTCCTLKGKVSTPSKLSKFSLLPALALQFCCTLDRQSVLSKEICDIEREFLLHQQMFHFQWQHLSLLQSKLRRISIPYAACSNKMAVSRTDITISDVKLIWEVTEHN